MPKVNLGFPQGSVLGPLLLLIYINDLSTGLSSNPRLFADDASLFSLVRDMTSSANVLNNDILMINNWAYQWKMSLKSGPWNQAQKVIFPRQFKKPSHPVLIFNNNQAIQTPYQEPHAIFSDGKLNFGEHLRYITKKINKSIGLLHRLHQPLSYLYEILPLKTTSATQHRLIIYPFFIFFKNLFFLSPVTEWSNLYLSIQSFERLGIFKKSIIQFIRPSASSKYNCFNSKRIKHLTRLRLRLSHHCDSKFKRDFFDALRPT